MNAIKLVRMVKRPANQTPAEFRQEWLEQQRELRGRIGRVVASVATGEVALGGKTPPFDGMAALYFSTEVEARAALHDDPERTEVVCDEHLMSQKPDAEKTLKKAGQLKVVRTVIRRKDLTPAQFKSYWLTNHSKLESRVMRESPVQRIVASFAIPEKHGNEPAFDGMVELYFASVDDIRTTFTGPIPAMMRKDEENFVQMDAPAVRMIADEFSL